MMNRIVLHHTGGPGTPTALDRAHYHRIVDAGGAVHDGDHPISANAPGRPLRAGTYAGHTLNLNSGAIGLSMCAMGGAQWDDPKGSTRFFPTEAQVTGLIREAARLCRIYGIPVTRETVLTHAEVQTTLGVKQRQKWDSDYDPFGVLDTRDPLVIGDMLRDRIRDEIARQASEGRPLTVPPEPARPVLRRGSKGEDVRALQEALTAAGHDTRGADGQFGPATHDALIAFQKARQLRPDAVAGAMTWAALFPLPDA